MINIRCYICSIKFLFENEVERFSKEFPNIIIKFNTDLKMIGVPLFISLFSSHCIVENEK